VAVLITGMAQAARFDRISIEQGLSETTVYCALQDKKGFLWFATQDGLNRYDGYEFRVFRHDDRDPSSLMSGFITSCLIDSTGSIWIGSARGLDRFEPSRFTAEHFTHEQNNPHSLSDDHVTAIAEDHAGRIWVGTSDGLNTLDVGSAEVQRYRHDPDRESSIAGDEISVLYVDYQGAVWIGTRDHGLDRYLPASDGFGHMQAGENSLADNRIRTITGDVAGALWIGTVIGLDRVDIAAHKIRHYHHDPADSASLPPGAISALWMDANGRLWVGSSGGGLAVLDSGDSGFKRFLHSPDDPASLSNDNVISILRDDSGVLWVGTWGGVNKLVWETNLFKHVLRISSGPNQLSDNAIWSIMQDHSGALWVGTDVGGLNRIDPTRKEYTHFRHQADRPDSLGHDRVYALLEDHKHRLWVGTAGGLDRLRKQGGFVHFRHDPARQNSLSDNRVTSLLETREDVLWVGTHNGLNQWLGNGKGFRSFMPGNPRDGGLCHARVDSLYEDHDGILWVGTHQGLARYRPADQSFVCYANDPKNPASLSGRVVLSILQGTDGGLWVGTFDGGLNRMDIATGQFHHYTMSDGLPNNVVYGILEDQFGLLWLSTNKGISRFNPRTGVFTNFDVRDGLQDYQFSQHAFFASESGEFFFGGFNGFNSFYPADFMAGQAKIPVVQLTGLRIFNEPVGLARTDPNSPLRVDLPYTKKLVLPDSRAMYSFEFAVMDLSGPKRNLYRYRLDGYDQQWWVTDAQHRRATYTNLDPGSYTFRVQGANPQEIWTRNDASVQISLLPPYWRTTWAYVLYGMFLVSLVWGFFHHHNRRLASIRQAKRVLEREVRSRTEALRAKNRELETLDDIVRTINRAVDLHRLPGILLDQALVLFPAAEHGAILLDEPGKDPHLVLAQGQRDDGLKPDDVQPARLRARYLDESARRADGIYVHSDTLRLRADCIDDCHASALAIALDGHGGFNALMILENASDPDAFTGLSIQMLSRFRQHALTAFAKAHLLQALTAKNADLLDAQTQLVEQEKMASLGSLVAGVAHEINTPLGIGVTAASHLKEVARDLNEWLQSGKLKRSDLEGFEGSVREGSQIILRNLQRAAKLVKSFKQVAVDQTGEVRRDFDLKTSLEELFTSLRPRFKRSRISIDLDCAEDIALTSYPGALSQIVSNLVINSLTHAFSAGEEGHISLVVRGQEHTVEFHYMDDGHGMEQDVLDHIYEPFFTTRRGDGGSGLGMHIVYNLVTQLLNGTIVCQSRPGHGLTVRFRIPKSVT